MREVARELAQWRAEGAQLALATVVRIEGTAPRPLGAKLLVGDDGRFAGSVSGGCIEGAVIGEALEALATGTPRLLHYGLPDDALFEIGLACGGTIDVFVEPLDGETGRLVDRLIELEAEGEPAVLVTAVAPAGVAGRTLLVREDGTVEGTPPAGWPVERIVAEALDLLGRGKAGHGTFPVEGDAGPVRLFFDVYAAQPRLVIFGAVHQAVPLAHFAKVCGWRVVVCDGREAFANRERFPDADEIIVAWPDEAAQRVGLDPRTYVAILTHDEKFDDPAVLAALRAGVRYLGAIGSRQTRQQQRERLAAQGVAPELLARIRGPIGLDLGATTPEETAISIMAEIIAVRHGREGGPLSRRSGPIHVETVV